MYQYLYRPGQTQNSVFTGLFHYMSQLATLCVILLVVFDGEREEFKRGVRVKKHPLWVEKGFKEMLDAMGIAWVDVCYSTLSCTMSLFLTDILRLLVKPRLS